MSELDVDPELVADLLTRFLRSEAGKFGFSKMVLGLSGMLEDAMKRESLLGLVGIFAGHGLEILGEELFEGRL